MLVQPGVGNVRDRFSHGVAHMVSSVTKHVTYTSLVKRIRLYVDFQDSLGMKRLGRDLKFQIKNNTYVANTKCVDETAQMRGPICTFVVRLKAKPGASYDVDHKIPDH